MLTKEYKTMLTIQYRMNQNIMRISSGYFYKNSLVADPKVKHIKLSSEIYDHAPVTLIDTAKYFVGEGYSESSKVNEGECLIIAFYYRYLELEFNI